MKYCLAFVLSIIAAMPVEAKDEVLIIVNKSELDVAAIKAGPGEILDFRRVLPGNKRTFTLRMPKGVCTTTLTTVLPNGQSFRDTVNVCGGIIFTFTAAPY